MEPNTLLLERTQIVVGIIPKDLGGGANSSDVVSLKNYGRCGILFIKDVGKTGEDPTITVLQATSIAPSGAKALNFTTIYTKQGALLSGVGAWTKVTQTAANTYTSATGGETENMWYVEFKAEDLDLDNDFDCIQVTIADVGTAGAYGTLLFLLGDPRYPDAPENMQSAIAN